MGFTYPFEDPNSLALTGNKIFNKIYNKKIYKLYLF